MANKKINLVIPLGGAGSRFSSKGYKEYKPFIEVGSGKSMIRSVIDNLYHQDLNFIFIINEGQISREDFIYHLRYDPIDPIVFTTPTLTDGPASSVLLAKEKIDNESPLIVINCDQIIKDFSLNNLVKFAEITEADGILGTFISRSDKNSYVGIDRNGEISTVVEKDVISDIATNGLHYWKKGSDFVSSAERMISKDDRTNGEFYIAPTYNYLIDDGKRVLPYFYNLHFPIGTPEDLEKYVKIFQNGGL
jgi:NDP-sugar pyrophosphorylase family protein